MVFHLRYGAIVTDYKTKKFIIATINTEGYPLVFLCQWEDVSIGKLDYYTLYDDALTLEQAEEILDRLKIGDYRKARTLLKRYFKGDSPCCDYVGPSVLEDTIPDKWFDVWKEMESVITATRDVTAYWECDVDEVLL